MKRGWDIIDHQESILYPYEEKTAANTRISQNIFGHHWSARIKLEILYPNEKKTADNIRISKTFLFWCKLRFLLVSCGYDSLCMICVYLSLLNENLKYIDGKSVLRIRSWINCCESWDWLCTLMFLKSLLPDFDILELHIVDLHSYSFNTIWIPDQGAMFMPVAQWKSVLPLLRFKDKLLEKLIVI